MIPDRNGSPSGVSLGGLNLVNFFLGVIIGVGIPFLTDYLKVHRWSFQNVGIATAMVGFGTLAFQGLSGLIAEKFPRHRLLMGGAIATYGASFSLLPLVIGTPDLVYGLLFLVGASGSFFFTLSATLAYSLSGHRLFPHTMGQNQMWNHGGFFAAAAGTMGFIHYLGILGGFLPIAFGSVLGLFSLLLVRPSDLIYHKTDVPDPSASADAKDPDLDLVRDSRSMWEIFVDFLKNPAIRVLLVSTTLFRLPMRPSCPFFFSISDSSREETESWPGWSSSLRSP